MTTVAGLDGGPRLSRYGGPTMRCPACDNDDTRVVDSRAVDDGVAIRRRRACQVCDHRFTTFERLEAASLRVVKRSGDTVEFDRERIVQGLRSAAKGRPVDPSVFEAIADEVEDQARSQGAEHTSAHMAATGLGSRERM